MDMPARGTCSSGTDEHLRVRLNKDKGIYSKDRDQILTFKSSANG